MLAGVAALVAGTLLARGAPWAEQPLPRLWPAPSFSLVDQQERPFGSAELRGRAAVASFIYTSCPDACPLLTATMTRVQDLLRGDGLLGTKVQLLSVTVDPRRDTPDVLAAYAKQYRADPDAWRFLSGDPEAIYEVLAGFKLNTVEVARASEGADIIPHSGRFVVIDPAGEVRAALPGDTIAPEEVVRAVRGVLP